jgi:hypothetical protein
MFAQEADRLSLDRVTGFWTAVGSSFLSDRKTAASGDAGRRR